MNLAAFYALLSLATLTSASPFESRARTVNELYAATVNDDPNVLNFMLSNVDRGCVRRRLNVTENGHKRLDEAIGYALLASAGTACFAEDEFLFGHVADKMVAEFAGDDTLRTQLPCLWRKVNELEANAEDRPAGRGEEKACAEFEESDEDLVQTLDFAGSLKELDLDDCVTYDVGKFRALVYRIAISAVTPTANESARQKVENAALLERQKENVRAFLLREARKSFECFMKKI